MTLSTDIISVGNNFVIISKKVRIRERLTNKLVFNTNIESTDDIVRGLNVYQNAHSLWETGAIFHYNNEIFAYALGKNVVKYFDFESMDRNVTLLEESLS